MFTAATTYHFSTHCTSYQAMPALDFTTSTITTSSAIIRQHSSGGTNCLEPTANTLSSTRINNKSPKNINLSHPMCIEYLIRYSVSKQLSLSNYVIALYDIYNFTAIFCAVLFCLNISLRQNVTAVLAQTEHSCLCVIRTHVNIASPGDQ